MKVVCVCLCVSYREKESQRMCVNTHNLRRLCVKVVCVRESTSEREREQPGRERDSARACVRASKRERERRTSPAAFDAAASLSSSFETESVCLFVSVFVCV